MHSDAFDVIPYEVQKVLFIWLVHSDSFIGHQRRLEEIRFWVVRECIQGSVLLNQGSVPVLIPLQGRTLA